MLSFELDTSDQSKLFRMVRRANGVAAAVLVYDECVYKDSELPAAFFRNLATPVDHNYDSNFFNLINKQYSSRMSLLGNSYRFHRKWQR